MRLEEVLIHSFKLIGYQWIFFLNITSSVVLRSHALDKKTTADTRKSVSWLNKLTTNSWGDRAEPSLVHLNAIQSS